MEKDTAITVTVYVFYGKWEGERIVGLEILNASKNLSLQNLLPIKCELSGLKVG